MIEIWGKPNCTFCDQAKSLCERRELKYIYKTLGTDFTREEILREFPNAKTFPQIKINNIAIGGHQELALYIEDTSYNGTGFSLS